MKDTTSVSVIIPVYKAEQYIHHCLDSMLAQTFKDFEIILIDDGSPDKSGEICDSYAAADNRIKVIRNEKNSGAAVSRNKALELAQGEFIAFLDSDDFFELNMLEETYNKIVRNGNFKSVMENLKYVSKLKKQGLINVFHINCVLTSWNYKDLIPLTKFAMELGACVHVMIAKDMGQGTKFLSQLDKYIITKSTLYHYGASIHRGP